MQSENNPAMDSEEAIEHQRSERFRLLTHPGTWAGVALILMWAMVGTSFAQNGLSPILSWFTSPLVAAVAAYAAREVIPDAGTKQGDQA